MSSPSAFIGDPDTTSGFPLKDCGNDIREHMKKFIFLLGMGLFFLAHNVFAEETIELKISHFAPPTWTPQKDILEPWAKKIETLTNGRIHFSFFPKEALGKGSEQYNLAVKGTADIALSVTEYSPGRFPLTSSMRLPFLSKSAERNSLVLWSLYQKYLQEEYKDTKVLWLFCHGAGHLHTVSKPVKTLEDIKGLRLRVADPALGKVVELLGAIPVVSTAPEGYQLLQEGKVDGAIIAWSGAIDFKYLELCKYHTEINMYTLPMFVAMNKEKYTSLPEDVKKIFDENSGEKMAVMTGRAFDNVDVKAKKIAQDRGDFIYSLPKAEHERWKKITVVVGDHWVEEMKAKGLPGQEVLAYVVDLFIQLQK